MDDDQCRLWYSEQFFITGSPVHLFQDPINIFDVCAAEWAPGFTEAGAYPGGGNAAWRPINVPTKNQLLVLYRIETTPFPKMIKPGFNPVKLVTKNGTIIREYPRLADQTWVNDIALAGTTKFWATCRPVVDDGFGSLIGTGQPQLVKYDLATGAIEVLVDLPVSPLIGSLTNSDFPVACVPSRNPFDVGPGSTSRVSWVG
jgi:hypothetical protein